MSITGEYVKGDIVVLNTEFAPFGRIVDSCTERYIIDLAGVAFSIPGEELIFISVKNVPNFRLIAQKIAAASQLVANIPPSFGQTVVDYVQTGSVVSRAFSDYVTKVPVDILAECLRQLKASQLTMPDAISRILNLNFKLISGG